MARVLHIEDDPANRILVRKLLTPHGYEVIDAVDGLEGIKLAIQHQPDLVLVDINLPHLNGYEVTLRLRGEETMKGVPIVAITAEGSRETSLAMGCDGYLQKPIDARSFAKEVGKYLGGKRESSPADNVQAQLREQSQRIVARLEAKVTELSAANERLRDAERARTAFYRSISHELATPMTPIVGYLKLLQDGELGPVSKAQTKALASMDECVHRLRGLIDNLLDVTGIETGKLRFFAREYDLSEVLQRALNNIKSSLTERKQTCVIDCPVGPIPGYGDPERLTRALGQLLDNATKFAPTKGAIGVRVAAQGDQYLIGISDTGPGVPPENATKIFEAWFQVDSSATREYGGVGVGLAIVAEVARGFGGSVRVLPLGDHVVRGVTFSGATFVLAIKQRAPELVAPT